MLKYLKHIVFLHSTYTKSTLSLSYTHTHTLIHTLVLSPFLSLFFALCLFVFCLLSLSLSFFPPSLFLSLVVICLCTPPLSLRSGWARCWYNIIWRITLRTFSPMGSLFLKISLSLSHALFLVVSGARTLSLFVTPLLLLSFLSSTLTLARCLAIACANMLSFEPLQF